ncbi:MAG TPA: hypothetical protein PLB26_13775, partial [Rubrivivax sp.]|nr:hypothetical protein [Rubrivivax sp.]
VGATACGETMNGRNGPIPASGSPGFHASRVRFGAMESCDEMLPCEGVVLRRASPGAAFRPFPASTARPPSLRGG